MENIKEKIDESQEEREENARLLLVQKRKRDAEEVITIQDAIQDHIAEEKELYEEALDQYQQNWGNEDKCTFDKGYINQPVYACKNCPNTFGFCYGCSMHCHIDHEIYELFKKRSFKCDCGTNRSGDIKCILQDKVHSDDNQDNIYNHNFDGKYCYCDQPYNFEEDMVQCLFCYDWYHETCVNLNSSLPTPELDDMQDYVCLKCLKNDASFLLDYPQIRLIGEVQVNHDIKKVKREQQQNDNDKENEQDKDKDIDITSRTTTNNQTNNNEQCKKLNNQNNSNNKNSSKIITDLYCKDGWRDELCKCTNCMKWYQDKKCMFIFDLPDTKNDDDDEEDEDDENDDQQQQQKDKDILEKKERIPREKKKPMNPFTDDNLVKTVNTFESKISQQQQHVLAEGYDEMKSKLLSFLSQKKDDVITKQDIQSVFKDLLFKKSTNR